MPLMADLSQLYNPIDELYRDQSLRIKTQWLPKPDMFRSFFDTQPEVVSVVKSAYSNYIFTQVDIPIIGIVDTVFERIWMKGVVFMDWKCPCCGGKGCTEMPETHARIAKALQMFPEEGALTAQLARMVELSDQSIPNLNNKLKALKSADIVTRVAERDPTGGIVYRWKLKGGII